MSPYPQDWTYWITQNTRGCRAVVEMGAGDFRQLDFCHDTVEKRVGIEIWPGHFEKPPRTPGCTAIQGDILHFEDLLAPEDMDCALCLDVLEHFEMPIACDLVRRIQRRFNRILAMIPEGYCPQGPTLGNPWNVHKSTWCAADVQALGFQRVRVWADFHPPETGKPPSCIFAVWHRED